MKYNPKKIKRLQVPHTLFGPLGRKWLDTHGLEGRFKIAQGPEYTAGASETPKEPRKPAQGTSGNINAPQPQKLPSSIQGRVEQTAPKPPKSSYAEDVPGVETVEGFPVYLHEQQQAKPSKQPKPPPKEPWEEFLDSRYGDDWKKWSQDKINDVLQEEFTYNDPDEDEFELDLDSEGLTPEEEAELDRSLSESETASSGAVHSLLDESNILEEEFHQDYATKQEYIEAVMQRVREYLELNTNLDQDEVNEGTTLAGSEASAFWDDRYGGEERR